MKVIVFDNDSVQVSQFEKLLYGILGDSMQLYKNPSFSWIVGSYDEYENALFFLDTRYKVAGSVKTAKNVISAFWLRQLPTSPFATKNSCVRAAFC